jgi:hypothetical protein
VSGSFSDVLRQHFVFGKISSLFGFIPDSFVFSCHAARRLWRVNHHLYVFSSTSSSHATTERRRRWR